MTTYYHVYADDGFETAHRSLREAHKAAKRGSARRKGIEYQVIAAGPDGTGSGRGRLVATYRHGQQLEEKA